MAPHGLEAALVFAGLVALLLLMLLVLDDDDEGDAVLVDGDPHGFGMAAPVDPSKVLFELGLLPPLLLLLPPPIWASMRGS